jgi:hypothetical protein
MMKTSRIPEGETVEVGEVFTDDPNLVARTKATRERPHFVAESLMNDCPPGVKHSVWFCSFWKDSKYPDGPTYKSFAVELCASQVGTVHNCCWLLNVQWQELESEARPMSQMVKRLTDEAKNNALVEAHKDATTPTYYWIIDRVGISLTDAFHKDGQYWEGLVGPKGADPYLLSHEDREHWVNFSIHDEDGMIVCAGRIYGEFCGTEPLKDFGMPELDCTRISLQRSKRPYEEWMYEWCAESGTWIRREKERTKYQHFDECPVHVKNDPFKDREDDDCICEEIGMKMRKEIRESDVQDRIHRNRCVSQTRIPTYKYKRN